MHHVVHHNTHHVPNTTHHPPLTIQLTAYVKPPTPTHPPTTPPNTRHAPQVASLPDQSLSDIPTDALLTGHHHPYDPLRPKRKKPAPTGAPKQRRKSLESHSGALVITWREDTDADGDGEVTGNPDGEAGGAGSTETEGGAAATGMEESTGAEASMLAEVVVDEALAIREPRPGSADDIAQVVSGARFATCK